MKKSFSQERDGVRIEAKLVKVGAEIWWEGTVFNGLVVEKFVAPDKDGVPDPRYYSLNAFMRIVNPDAEIWFAMCEMERWEGDAREKMPPEVGRYIARFASLLRDLFESSPDEDDPDYEPAHFARFSEESAFTLGYLIAEYQWKFQHEKDAITGKPVRKGAALGGQMSSKSKKRSALFAELRRRVSTGEKIGIVAADIVVQENLPIDPRSFERAYWRWARSAAR